MASFSSRKIIRATRYEIPPAAWLRKAIGEDLFFNVKEVDFRNRSLTDAGLRHLRGLGELQSLSLSDTQVTDAGLVQLESLTHLRELDLMRTSVADEDWPISRY